MQLKEADRTTAVAKGNQLLAEHPDLEREVREVVRKTDRLPETAHVFAAWRVRTDMGQL